MRSWTFDKTGNNCTVSKISSETLAKSTLIFNEHGSAKFPECGLFAYALQLNCSLAYSVAGCYLHGYSKIQSNRCAGHADSSNGSELLQHLVIHSTSFSYS